MSGVSPRHLCSSCHIAEAREAESWPGRIPASLKQDIHVNFSVREKKINYLSWRLSILFGINKMASARRLAETFRRKEAATLAGFLKKALHLTGCFLSLCLGFFFLNTFARIPWKLSVCQSRRTFWGIVRIDMLMSQRRSMIYHSLKILFCNAETVPRERWNCLCGVANLS